MLVAAAVCPHPPLLVPELAGAAAPELDDVRGVCLDVVGALIGTGVPVHVVGADTGERVTSMRPWGVDVAVPVPGPAPLPHLVAGWLLDRAGGAAAGWHLVAPDLPPERCLERGRGLVGTADVALLVMGDGSARHSEKAPGYLDPRAAGYDAAVAAALAGADAAALAGLDADLSAQLLAAGRAPWQVLAGASVGAPFRVSAAGWSAPYGVAYHHCLWTAAGR